jgi:glucosylceramidase
MGAQDRTALLKDLFSPTGLNMSVCRTCIGASDYSTSLYSFDDADKPDPSLQSFTIEHDKAYIIPSLKLARQLNPSLFLVATPWSPPGWMKVGGSMLGGMIEKRYFGIYAEYLTRFLKEYWKEGVPIRALTIQNEVDTDQDGKMPAALWGQEYEEQFIQDFLGPALKQTQMDVLIWILDHNYNLWGRALDELSNPKLAQYVDGVAWHAYGGGPEAMSKVHNSFPTKNTYWTEGGPDITSPTYLSEWCRWSQTFCGVLRNWSRCIVGWNILLDENGRPNLGPFPCGGLVTRNSKTGDIARSGQFWAFAHYSKAIKRGARIVWSDSSDNSLDHVAFVNPDGSSGIVITNSGVGQNCTIETAREKFAFYAEGNSITTVIWSN